EIYRVPMAYPLVWPGGPDQCAKDALDVITTLIHTQVGEDNVAAVIIEPIQCEGGFIVPPAGCLPGLAEFCARHGILLIADEIQTGFCRTGDWFACEHEGVVPDMVTTAKGIAGGLPLAAVTGRAEIMDSVHVGGLGGTYGGNPVACAAALGAIETMAAENLAGRARRMGEIMLCGLDGPAAAAPRGPLRGGAACDLAVVGGGFSGLWTALLAKEANPGRSVLLIEGNRIGWAASGRNGGFCEASLTHGADNGRERFPAEFGTLQRLGAENLDAIEAAIGRYGIDCDFERAGSITVATEDYQVGWLREAAAADGAEGS